MSKTYKEFCPLLIALALAACGGESEPPPPPPPAIYTVTADISGLPAGTNLALGLKGGPAETISADGSVTLTQKIADAGLYQVIVAQQPTGAYCTVRDGIGRAAAADVNGVKVQCSTEAAAALFDTNRLQRLRLTVSVDDWNAFVLNTARSIYTRNAHGGASWTLASVSEVYRRGQLDYLGDNGQVLASVPDVAFRMRGNTSRVWPEGWVFNQRTNAWTNVPRRFHINLKFDEDFSDDESVYACVDSAGQPAAVNTEACMNRVADDVPTVAANKDRTFMGLESFALKYNKDDPTYLREVLSHAVMTERGVPAGRAAHASLELVITPSARSTTLFGRPLPQTYQMGVFGLMEPVDKLLVQRLYGKNGYVFKTSGGDLTRQDKSDCVAYELGGHSFVNSDFCVMGVEQIDPINRTEWLGAALAGSPTQVNSDINRGGPLSQFAPYTPTYDLKTKKSDIALARAALNALIGVLNTETTTAADLEAVFDVNSFIKAQAVDIAIGAVDHYVRVANNYYLYLNPNTKKWVYLPYDYDFSFRDGHIASWPLNSSFRNVAASTALQGENSWRAKRMEGINPRLYDLVFSDPANQQKLLAELRAIDQKWLTWSGRLEPLVTAWLDRLEPAIAATDVAEPGSGDTLYNRTAATGDAYTYRSWVNADNPLASDYAPNREHDGIPSNDTIKRFVQTRKAALATELAQ